MGAVQELNRQMKPELLPAKSELSTVYGPTGEQMTLPGIELPKVKSSNNNLKIKPKAFSGTPQNQFTQNVPNITNEQLRIARDRLMRINGQPSTIGITLPRPDIMQQKEGMEGWIWGTMKHLAKGTVFGVADMFKGIIDIEKENREIGGKLKELINEYQTASPDRKEQIKIEVANLAENKSNNFAEKLLKHGVDISKDMLALTIQAPFKTISRSLNFVDKLGKRATGEYSSDDLKREWFKTLDNIVPIALDALVVFGGIKGVKKAVREMKGAVSYTHLTLPTN